MKFIHLGDLHIGKRVNDFSMIKDQEYVLNQIIDIAIKEKVDGILIAGDVYDKTIPSAEAVVLFDEFLTRIVNENIKVYIISGNHDSSERLAFAKKLMENSGVYISPVFDGKVSKEVFEDENGKANIYMLPFIKPVQVKKYYEESTIENYNDAVKLVMNNLNIDENERNIILVHQFVTGAQTCESEELAIGGLDNISIDNFDRFDYVALGHIHSPQKIKKDTIRYSGTPIKYSLSEINHKKIATIVEVKEKGNIQIEEVLLKPLHDMRRVKGTYDEITLRDNYINTNTDDYMYITLTDEEDIPDAIGRLRSIYPNIMKLDYDNQRTRMDSTIGITEKVEEKKPIELFSELFELQNNQKLTEEQEEYMNDMIESIWEGR